VKGTEPGAEGQDLVQWGHDLDRGGGTGPGGGVQGLGHMIIILLYFSSCAVQYILVLCIHPYI
jgi:hypothetical protein